MRPGVVIFATRGVFVMLNAKSSIAVFEKLRSAKHPHGEIVMVAFDDKTPVRGLKSTAVKTADISDMGEMIGDMFSVRIAAADFTPPPAEKDIVTLTPVIPGLGNQTSLGTPKDYQVAETRYSGFGSILRLFILDEDS